MLYIIYLFIVLMESEIKTVHFVIMEAVTGGPKRLLKFNSAAK